MGSCERDMGLDIVAECVDELDRVLCCFVIVLLGDGYEGVGVPCDRDCVDDSDIWEGVGDVLGRDIVLLVVMGDEVMVGDGGVELAVLASVGVCVGGSDADRLADRVLVGYGEEVAGWEGVDDSFDGERVRGIVPEHSVMLPSKKASWMKAHVY